MISRSASRFAFALAVGCGLFAAWPLFTRVGLPTNTDADLHIFRTDQILRAWAQGVWYVRWAPDLALGYGYPVFNYYAPLAHYAAALYARWGGGAVAGVKFVLVASAVMGAAGMFALAREWWGDVGGLISGAAFSFAPYVAYVNPVARGAISETLAVALAPGVWWLLVRLRRGPTFQRLIGAAFGIAALTLAHNLLSFVFLALILLWLAWETIGQWRSVRWAVIVSALVLGFGLSAFMWLPAVLERGAVQFQRALATVQDLKATLRFVTVKEMLMPTTRHDLAALPVETWVFRLGLPQWALAAVGALTIVRPSSARRTTAFLISAGSGVLWLMTPQATGFWRNLPFLIYLRLPWRLLGPAAIVLALLAGVTTHWLRPPAQFPAAFAVLALILFCAWPLLNPLPWADYGPVSLDRLWRFERQGNIGTTAQNEFLPASVQVMPPSSSALLQSYLDGLVNKLDLTTLPPGANTRVLSHSPIQDTFDINSSSAATLTFFTFAFPGWAAYVDGQPTVIIPSTPYGLITMKVPAGSHRLTLRFENTPARWLSWLISAVALVMCGGVMVFYRFPARSELAPYSIGEQLTLPQIGAMAALLAIATALCWWLNRPAIWQTRPPPVSNSLAVFDGHIELASADLPPAFAHPGDTLFLALHWRAIGPAPRDLSVFIHLIGSDGQLWGQSDKPRPAAQWPTDRWPTGHLFDDPYQLAIRPDTPSGKYTVCVGLWNSYTGERMHILNADSHRTDQDSAVLMTDLVVQP